MNGEDLNFEGRACPVRPMSVEDHLSRLSPLCAHARMVEGLEMTLMRSIRIQGHAYFVRQEMVRSQVLRSIT